MARYYSGGRRRYIYDSQVTLRCPYRTVPPETETLHFDLVPGRIEQRVEQAEEALAPLGLDARLLLRHAHRGSGTLDDGKSCAYCGAALVRVGYRVWVEGRYADVVEELRRLGQEEEARATETSARINERLGGDGWRIWPNSVRYFVVKREGIAWCREQAAIERSTAEVAAET